MHRNMPVDLVLVRHGQSEGNLAQKLARQGQLDLWTSEFRERHNSLYRLTDTGRMQARIAGEYIRRKISPIFDKYFTSEYVRAMETAAALELPHARWATEVYLRERDRGVLANKPHQERVIEHQDEFVRKERDAFYWQPSGGESIANLCLRVDRVLENLGENCSGLRVIVVCHGGVIKSFRALIERVRSTEYRSHDKIHNCQIVWYTRRDPKTGYISSKYNWVKSLCPWDLHLSRYTNEWKEIRRHVYSNVELLRSVGQVVQLVNWPLNAGNVSSESSTAPGNAWPYGIVGYTDSSDSDEGFSNIRQPSNCQPILKAGNSAGVSSEAPLQKTRYEPMASQKQIFSIQKTHLDAGYGKRAKASFPDKVATCEIPCNWEGGDDQNSEPTTAGEKQSFPVGESCLTKKAAVHTSFNIPVLDSNARKSVQTTTETAATSSSSSSSSLSTTIHPEELAESPRQCGPVEKQFDSNGVSQPQIVSAACRPARVAFKDQESGDTAHRLNAVLSKRCRPVLSQSVQVQFQKINTLDSFGRNNSTEKFAAETHAASGVIKPPVSVESQNARLSDLGASVMSAEAETVLTASAPPTVPSSVAGSSAGDPEAGDCGLGDTAEPVSAPSISTASTSMRVQKSTDGERTECTSNLNSGNNSVRETITNTAFGDAPSSLKAENILRHSWLTSFDTDSDASSVGEVLLDHFATTSRYKSQLDVVAGCRCSDFPYNNEKKNDRVAPSSSKGVLPQEVDSVESIDDQRRSQSRPPPSPKLCSAPQHIASSQSQLNANFSVASEVDVALFSRAPAPLPRRPCYQAIETNENVATRLKTSNVSSSSSPPCLELFHKCNPYRVPETRSRACPTSELPQMPATDKTCYYSKRIDESVPSLVETNVIIGGKKARSPPLVATCSVGTNYHNFNEPVSQSNPSCAYNAAPLLNVGLNASQGVEMILADTESMKPQRNGVNDIVTLRETELAFRRESVESSTHGMQHNASVTHKDFSKEYTRVNRERGSDDITSDKERQLSGMTRNAENFPCSVKPSTHRCTVCRTMAIEAPIISALVSTTGVNRLGNSANMASQSSLYIVDESEKRIQRVVDRQSQQRLAPLISENVGSSANSSHIGATAVATDDIPLSAMCNGFLPPAHTVSAQNEKQLLHQDSVVLNDGVIAAVYGEDKHGTLTEKEPFCRILSNKGAERRSASIKSFVGLHSTALAGNDENNRQSNCENQSSMMGSLFQPKRNQSPSKLFSTDELRCRFHIQDPTTGTVPAEKNAFYSLMADEADHPGSLLRSCLSESERPVQRGLQEESRSRTSSSDVADLPPPDLPPLTLLGKDNYGSSEPYIRTAYNDSRGELFEEPCRDFDNSMCETTSGFYFLSNACRPASFVLVQNMESQPRKPLNIPPLPVPYTASPPRSAEQSCLEHPATRSGRTTMLNRHTPGRYPYINNETSHSAAQHMPSSVCYGPFAKPSPLAARPETRMLNTVAVHERKHISQPREAETSLASNFGVDSSLNQRALFAVGDRQALRHQQLLHSREQTFPLCSTEKSSQRNFKNSSKLTETEETLVLDINKESPAARGGSRNDNSTLTTQTSYAASGSVDQLGVYHSVTGLNVEDHRAVSVKDTLQAELQDQRLEHKVIQKKFPFLLQSSVSPDNAFVSANTHSPSTPPVNSRDSNTYEKTVQPMSGVGVSPTSLTNTSAAVASHSASETVKTGVDSCFLPGRTYFARFPSNNHPMNALAPPEQEQQQYTVAAPRVAAASTKSTLGAECAASLCSPSGGVCLDNTCGFSVINSKRQSNELFHAVGKLTSSQDAETSRPRLLSGMDNVLKSNQDEGRVIKSAGLPCNKEVVGPTHNAASLYDQMLIRRPSKPDALDSDDSLGFCPELAHLKASSENCGFPGQNGPQFHFAAVAQKTNTSTESVPACESSSSKTIMHKGPITEPLGSCLQPTLTGFTSGAPQAKTAQPKSLISNGPPLEMHSGTEPVLGSYAAAMDKESCAPAVSSLKARKLPETSVPSISSLPQDCCAPHCSVVSSCQVESVSGVLNNNVTEKECSILSVRLPFKAKSVLIPIQTSSTQTLPFSTSAATLNSSNADQGIPNGVACDASARIDDEFRAASLLQVQRSKDQQRNFDTAPVCSAESPRIRTYRQGSNSRYSEEAEYVRARCGTTTTELLPAVVEEGLELSDTYDNRLNCSAVPTSLNVTHSGGESASGFFVDSASLSVLSSTDTVTTRKKLPGQKTSSTRLPQSRSASPSVCVVPLSEAVIRSISRLEKPPTAQDRLKVLQGDDAGFADLPTYTSSVIAEQQTSAIATGDDDATKDEHCSQQDYQRRVTHHSQRETCDEKLNEYLSRQGSPEGHHNDSFVSKNTLDADEQALVQDRLYLECEKKLRRSPKHRGSSASASHRHLRTLRLHKQAENISPHSSFASLSNAVESPTPPSRNSSSDLETPRQAPRWHNDEMAPLPLKTSSFNNEFTAVSSPS